MASIARIPITNVYMEGDYTGTIVVGPLQKQLNVILDTGSSSLALDGTKFTPDLAGGDAATQLLQSDTYGDNSSWTGAVVKSTVSVGVGAEPVTLPGANVAVAYEESANMFNGSDGILGLAYAPLDGAYQMPAPTWPKRYTSADISGMSETLVAPYLTQLASAGTASDKVSFFTQRSFVNNGAGGADDPLNMGWMILGGGVESTDLYTGAFQIVKVLADQWYNTNLLSIRVGTKAVGVPSRTPKGMPSNSIVDSGTNSLNLGPALLKSLFSKFSAAQSALLSASVLEQKLVPMSQLNLATWPTLTFVLQGLSGNVELAVSPNDYWQVNAPKVGSAMAAITKGQDGLAILGLPLMNGYFTIFDGEADGGKGTINFATSLRGAPTITKGLSATRAKLKARLPLTDLSVT